MTEHADQGATGKRPSLTLVLLFMVFLVPTLAAVVVYNIKDLQPAGMTNYGELLSPARPLQPFTLNLSDGSVLDVERLKGLWTLVSFTSGDCGPICQQNIYKMRQMRWSQGDQMNRVQRLLVFIDQTSMDKLAAVVNDYPGMMVGSGSPQQARQLTSQFHIKGQPAAETGDNIYIIDPLGNLMMSYPRDADPRLMLKDLKRLLKFSRVG
jgi:cytochrome oxidase Cu insertion factor (SCO1/SenC/PrrC family)